MTLPEAFLNLFTLKPFLIMLGGVALGISVGVLPGITAGVLMALTLPFTYHMSSVEAVTLLISMFVGGVSGGLITATLMRIPGEPNAIMTCLDGYQLARRGYPGRALGLGNASSLVGGTLSWFALVLLAPPLASIAVAFGPFENFAVIVMALILISSLSEGSFLKGLSAGMLGMLVSYPGIDQSSGIVRLTFGFTELEGGFNPLPVILGMFAISQVVADALNIEGSSEAIKATMRGMFMSVRDYVVHGMTMLRSSLIGIWMGILPGVGATIASIVTYSVAKNMSKNPDEFGKGSEEAIVAVESANNATTGGTLIPILTLGISGGLTDSILLGALIIHNMQPGPLLFQNHPEIVNTIFASHLTAHLVMFAMMTFGVAFFARMMMVPRAFILPMVIVFSVIGAFALDNRPFDIGVMLAFGLLGVLLEVAKVPLAPFVVGLVLAPIAESELRSGLMASAGSFMPLVERPMALTMLIIAALLFVWPFIREIRSAARQSKLEKQISTPSN
ncbi:tripartite tricarboxylate transporter permease [Leptospira interrogans]